MTKPTIISIHKINDVKYMYSATHREVYCKCPECGGDVTRGLITCPDDKEGCIVCHHGFGCEDCKVVYDIKYTVPNAYTKEEALKFVEQISVGLINPRECK